MQKKKLAQGRLARMSQNRHCNQGLLGHPVLWTPGEAITAITSSITDPSLEGARGMGARFPGAHSDSSPDTGDDCQLWYVKTIFKAAFDEMSASYLQESPCNRA